MKSKFWEFSKENQPSSESKSRGNKNRNYRNEILRKVMGNKVSDVCSEGEIKKLFYIHATKYPSIEALREATVEDVITQNLSRYCVNNGEAVCATNALQVIKHLCSHTLEDMAEQLQLNLTLGENSSSSSENLM
jgi:hypothetical protein